MRTTNSDNINEKDLEFFKSFKEKSSGEHKKLPSVICWNKEGNFLMTGQTVIKIWAFNEQLGLESVNQIKGHDSLINEAKFINNNILMTMSRDLLKIWDIRGSALKSVRTQKKQKSDFMDIAWKNDMQMPQFTILFKDGQLSSYDLRGASLNQSMSTSKPSLQINQINWDKKDNVLFASYLEGGSGQLALFDANLQQIPQTFQLHNGRINAIEVSQCNQYLVTCSDDSVLQIHSLPDIICTAAYSHTDTPYKKVSISPNAEYIAVSCDEPYIHFYNIQNGGHAYKLGVNSSNQQLLAWHPKKQILAYIDEEEKKYIRLFSQI